MFLKAPPELIPVPFNVSASAPIEVFPDNSNAAPLVTVTPPAVVPRAVMLAALNAPAEIVVKPVYEFPPDKVNIPAPAFVRVVPTPEIIPE